MLRAGFPVLPLHHPPLPRSITLLPVVSNPTMELSEMQIIVIFISNTYMVLTICQALFQMLAFGLTITL